MDLGGGELRVGDEMRDLQQEDAADLDLMPMPPSRGYEQEHVGDYGRRPSTSVSSWSAFRAWGDDGHTYSKHRVAVIGSGNWGSAVAHLIASNTAKLPAFHEN